MDDDGVIINGTKAIPSLNVLFNVNGFDVVVTVRASGEGSVYFTFNCKQYLTECR